MRRTLFSIAALLSLVAPCRAEDAKAPPAAAEPMPEEILWMQDVPAAFERAKKDAKPLLIAINAAFVDGGKAEPAGKELRDHTYKAKEVVAKAQLFVCALLKPDATSADYAELRTRFGMDGLVVSPQHIFVHADGTLIGRHEYWPHAHGQPSVDALLKLMDEALAAHKAKTGAGGGPVPTDPAAGVDARAAWIREQVAKLRDTTLDFATREVAGKELIKGDQKGDCLDPVCTFLLDAKKDTELQVALVRALGKPGLEFVVPTLCQLLDDRSDELRSNVAVTLEYVGSVRAVEPLTKRIGKEKDEYTWNNCCRALGRCGVKQEAVRKFLLREATTAKSDKLSAGPAIGLAYFERDAEAARGVEKIVEKGSSWQKRAFLLYTLTEIKDPKSGDFVREKVLKHEKNQMALGFLNAVVGVLTGSDETGTAQGTVEGGVGYAVGSLGGVGGSARIGRDQSEFKPKGEFAGRGPGGRGGPGGGPGGAPGMGG